MTRILLFFSCLVITIISFGQNNEFNFGFEKFNSGAELPDKWFEWGSGYNLKVDTITKHSGKASVRIEAVGKKIPNSFGCVAYAIPSKYEAKEIELRAYMKLDNVTDGPIGLMIRIDGPSGMLALENMQSKSY
jgi:hypothetical protein